MEGELGRDGSLSPPPPSLFAPDKQARGSENSSRLYKNHFKSSAWTDARSYPYVWSPRSPPPPNPSRAPLIFSPNRIVFNFS